MRKRKSGRKFGRKSALRRAFLGGITEAVFRHGRIRTTEARAKEVRRIVDRAITVGKQQTLVARRKLEGSFSSPVAKAIIDDIAPRFHDRHGGYTRILKLGPRRGDRAPMVYLELVERGEVKKGAKKGK